MSVSVSSRPLLLNHPLVRLAILLGLLYVFFVSISLLAASFQFFGKDVAEQLLSTTANPFIGLFIGVLATSLLQSSSTTTSMTVALVAAGGLDVTRAIPIIMGANMGTSVTNTLVSVGHIGRPIEFKRAFAAATVHDFFNLITILILFPLQLSTDVLGKSSAWVASLVIGMGGLKFANPLKIIVTPSVKLITHATGETGWIMLVISVILLFVALRYIVVNLKVLVVGKVDNFFNQRLFRRAWGAMLVGLVLTVAVQSSSITTSLAVPLAGAGILTLVQIFPFTLGANVGTTVTALLAALVTGSAAAITVAIAHLMFNILGIILVWPIRRLPMWMAEAMGSLALRSRLIPLAYVAIVFFLIPLVLIYFMG